jgi:hypothetical protein
LKLLTVLRYVEANPVRGGLVAQAQDWLQYLNGPADGIERLRRAVVKAGNSNGAWHHFPSREHGKLCQAPFGMIDRCS